MRKFFKVLAAIAIVAQMAMGQQNSVSLLNREWKAGKKHSSDICVLTRPDGQTGRIAFEMKRGIGDADTSNVGIGSSPHEDDNWSQVTGFDITYSSNFPLSIVLYDEAGNCFVDETTLSAALKLTTKKILLKQLILQKWWIWGSNNNPEDPNPTVPESKYPELKDRFRGITSIGIQPRWENPAISHASGEISELIVHGLKDTSAGDECLDFAQDKDGWDGNITGGANGNIDFTLNASKPYMDFDYIGDWSKFRGIMLNLRTDADYKFYLKTAQGDDLFYYDTLPLHLEPYEDKALFLPFANFDKGYRNIKKSVLDATITGIRIAAATPGATVNGTIKKMEMKGIDIQDIQVNWDTSKIVYNAAAQVPTASAKTKSGTPLALTISGAKTDAGTYTATAELMSANTAYKLTNKIKQFTIAKAPISPVLNAATIKQGETLAPNVTGNLGGGNVNYAYSTSAGQPLNTVPSAIGTYSVKAAIGATNNYLAGETKSVQFAIVPQEAQTASVEWGATTSFVYDGTMKAPGATVKGAGGRTVSLIVDGGIVAGTHTATARLEVPDENFYLTNTTKPFSITKKALSPNMISPIDNALWAGGKAIKPNITVKDGERTLAQGIDYTLAYSNNTDVGMATVTIKGSGNYSDSAKCQFEILSTAMGITFAYVTWSSATFTYNGQAQAPTATVKDVWGNVYDATVEGKQTNAGTYVANVRINAAKHPGKFFILDMPMTAYTIKPKQLAVAWSNPKEFTYNKMVQVPKPSVAETGLDLRVVGAQSAVGEYKDLLAPFVQIVSANAGNYELTGNSVDYEIRKKELVVKLDLPSGEAKSGDTISIEGDFATDEALLAYLNSLVTFNGFATDTTGITDKSDNVNVVSGKPKVKVTKVDNDNSQRSSRAAVRYLIDFDMSGVSADNYEVVTKESPTPIKDIKKSDKKFGIIIEKNPVTGDFAEIKIRASERAETKVVIYDNVGNVVFEATTREDKVVWDLRNGAGRSVANGTYLVVAQVRGSSGKTWGYSAKLGVRR